MAGEGKYRSAISGRYVSPYYAKRHPDTTIKEGSASEGKGWEVREETGPAGARIVVAPEGMEPRPSPRLLGEVSLEHDIAEQLLRAIAWYGHGDREASQCSVYVYDQDLEAVRVGLGITVHRFDDGEYGQGYRFDMTPVVKSGNLPLTAIEDELVEDEADDED